MKKYLVRNADNVLEIIEAEGFTPQGVISETTETDASILELYEETDEMGQVHTKHRVDPKKLKAKLDLEIADKAAEALRETERNTLRARIQAHQVDAAPTVAKLSLILKDLLELAKR